MAFTDQQIKDFITSNSGADSYAAAQKYGISASQIDNAMGWDAGATTNYTKTNNLASLSAPTKPVSLTSGNAYTAAQSQYGTGYDANKAFYDQGKAANVSANFMDSAGGFAPGTSAAWIAGNGLEQLKTPTYQAASDADIQAARDTQAAGVQRTLDSFGGTSSNPIIQQMLDARKAQDAASSGTTPTRIDDPPRSGGLLGSATTGPTTTTTASQGTRSPELEAELAAQRERYDQQKADGTLSPMMGMAELKESGGDWREQFFNARFRQEDGPDEEVPTGPITTGAPATAAPAYTGAVARQVNASTDTMQGQLTSLLDKNSPLMQRAYYQGLDQANSRGLLNSSMGGEAAQNALFDKAIQIAGPDAAAYLKQGMTNQGYQNDFNMNDRKFDQTLTRDEIQHGYTMERDATLDGFQTGRDATLNGYQTTRDATLDGYQTNRDAALDGYQTARDGRLDGFQTNRDERLDGYQTARDIRLAEDARAAAAASVDAQAAAAAQAAEVQRERDATAAAVAVDAAEAAANVQFNRDTLLSEQDMDRVAATTTANTHGIYMDGIMDIRTSATDAINILEATPGLSAEDLATQRANIIERRDLNIEYLGKMFTDMPTWDIDWLDWEDMPNAPGLTEFTDEVA